MPKELVASDGAVAWSASHSAYGRIVSTYQDPEAATRYANNPVKSPFRLLGQVADEDAELCWTRFRCFDPETGTWMSTDPLEIEGGLNLYGFDGAPTDVVDPHGLMKTGDKHGSGGEVLTTVPTDLHAFGNASGPRPPRIDNATGKSDLTTSGGLIQPSTTQGASTFGDPNMAHVSGNYHRLPAGTELPEGLGVVADGSDVGARMLVRITL